MEIYTVKVHTNGDRSWYQNDKLHRVDGPAPETLKHWDMTKQNGKPSAMVGTPLKSILELKNERKNPTIC